VVFSRTLTRLEPAWAQSRLASRPVVDEIRALKASGGRDLALFGSATLAATVLAAGLIDEVRVIVNPVMLGGGQPMFRDPADRLGLELTSVERFRKGSVLLIYEPRRPAG
jgi:dihydrofolate reductase